MSNSSFDFKGRVAIVTGGTSGIGAATAIRLAQLGAAVAIVGRSQDRGSQVLGEVKQHSPDSTFIQADISRVEEIRKTFQIVRATYARLDFAFNNAGAFGSGVPVATVEESELDLIFATNVKGLAFCMQEELTLMKEKGTSGSIVNNSSIGGYRVMAPGFTVYAASKSAVIALTKGAAVEEAATGIRINAVAPGPIETPMLMQASGGDPQSFAGSIPMGRIGAPLEVAEAVCWLLSDQSSYVTGHTLAVDGGVLAQ